ncbi:hypothetical protein FACS189449_05250 [Alphaproteobacteria bacterium]|nr:hypothetical protein FACS189449_05250 [Alphaproteobacteria bacterium]
MNKTMSVIKGAIYALLFMTTASLFALTLDARNAGITNIHFDSLTFNNLWHWNLSLSPDPSKGLNAYADVAQYFTHCSGSDNLDIDTIAPNDSGSNGAIDLLQKPPGVTDYQDQK